MPWQTLLENLKHYFTILNVKETFKLINNINIMQHQIHNLIKIFTETCVKIMELYHTPLKLY